VLLNFLQNSKIKYSFFLLLIGLLTYSPSLFISFFGDEPAFIERNEVHSLASWFSLMDKKDYDGDYYRPVGNLVSGTLTFFLGRAEWGYRLFNLLLHSFNGILLFLLASQIFKNYNLNLIPAFLAGLLFIVFPAHDLAVIWHTDLFDRLLFLFYISSILLYVKDKIYLSLFFALLAFLTKEMSFSLPAIIFISGYLISKKCIRELSKDLLSFSALLFLVIGFRYLILGNYLFQSELTHPDTGLIGILKNYLFFGGILVLPFNTYMIEEIAHAYFPIFISFGVIISGAIVYTFYKNKSSRRLFLFAGLLIILTILPASRLLMKWYLYLPSTGFIILLVLTIESFRSKTSRKVVYLIIATTYFISLLYIQYTWVNLTSTNDDILASLKNKYNLSEKSDLIYFLTIPAKIGNYPINHLNSAELFRYKLDITNDIEVLSRSSISNWSDKIDCFYTQNGIRLMHTNSNYFIVYGYENLLTFDSTDFVQGKLRALNFSGIPDSALILSYSEGKYFKVE